MGVVRLPRGQDVIDFCQREREGPLRLRAMTMAARAPSLFARLNRKYGPEMGKVNFIYGIQLKLDPAVARLLCPDLLLGLARLCSANINFGTSTWK